MSVLSADLEAAIVAGDCAETLRALEDVDIVDNLTAMRVITRAAELGQVKVLAAICEFYVAERDDILMNRCEVLRRAAAAGQTAALSYFMKDCGSVGELETVHFRHCVMPAAENGHAETTQWVLEQLIAEEIGHGVASMIEAVTRAAALGHTKVVLAIVDFSKQHLPELGFNGLARKIVFDSFASPIPDRVLSSVYRFFGLSCSSELVTRTILCRALVRVGALEWVRGFVFNAGEWDVIDGALAPKASEAASSAAWLCANGIGVRLEDTGAFYRFVLDPSRATAEWRFIPAIRSFCEAKERAGPYPSFSRATGLDTARGENRTQLNAARSGSVPHMSCHLS